MNVIQCKQTVLIDMVHQQSHGKSRWVRGGCHIAVDTSAPKSPFHWKIPIYCRLQILSGFKVSILLLSLKEKSAKMAESGNSLSGIFSKNGFLWVGG